MKFTLSVLLLVLSLTSYSAHADTIDRIDACEAAGGGACVFTLLRELARGGPNSYEPSIILEEGEYKMLGSCGSAHNYGIIQIDSNTLDVVITRYVMLGEPASLTCDKNKCQGKVQRYGYDFTLTKSSTTTFSIKGYGYGESGCAFKKK